MKHLSLLALVAVLSTAPVSLTRFHLCSGLGAEGLIAGASTTFGLFEAGHNGYEIEIRCVSPEDSVHVW